MAKFCRKTVIVEAIQFDGRWTPVRKFLGRRFVKWYFAGMEIGSWVIKEPQAQIYFLCQELFEQNYRAIRKKDRGWDGRAQNKCKSV